MPSAVSVCILNSIINVLLRNTVAELQTVQTFNLAHSSEQKRPRKILGDATQSSI